MLETRGKRNQRFSFNHFIWLNKFIFVSEDFEHRYPFILDTQNSSVFDETYSKATSELS